MIFFFFNFCQTLDFQKQIPKSPIFLRHIKINAKLSKMFISFVILLSLYLVQGEWTDFCYGKCTRSCISESDCMFLEEMAIFYKAFEMWLQAISIERCLESFWNVIEKYFEKWLQSIFVGNGKWLSGVWSSDCIFWTT